MYSEAIQTLDKGLLLAKKIMKIYFLRMLMENFYTRHTIVLVYGNQSRVAQENQDTKHLKLVSAHFLTWINLQKTNKQKCLK